MVRRHEVLGSSAARWDTLVRAMPGIVGRRAVRVQQPALGRRLAPPQRLRSKRLSSVQTTAVGCLLVSTILFANWYTGGGRKGAECG